MSEKKTEAVWCPYARLTLQYQEAGQFRNSMPVSWNQLAIVDWQSGEVGKAIHPSTPCLREKCAMWRPKLLPWQKDTCGMVKQDAGPWILAALVIIEIIAIAGTYLLTHPSISRMLSS